MIIKMSSTNNKEIFEINGLQFNFYWIFKYVWLCHIIIIDSTQHIYFYWSQLYIKTLSWTIFELLTPLKLHLMPCSLIVIHNEKSIATVQFHHFVHFSVRVLKFHNLVEKRFYVRAWTKNFCRLICLKKKRSNRSNFKLYYGQYYFEGIILPKIKNKWIYLVSGTMLSGLTRAKTMKLKVLLFFFLMSVRNTRGLATVGNIRSIKDIDQYICIVKKIL